MIVEISCCRDYCTISVGELIGKIGILCIGGVLDAIDCELEKRTVWIRKLYHRGATRGAAVCD